MDDCGFFIYLCYRSDGCSNHLEGIVCTTHDCTIFLLVRFDEAEAGLACAIFSEELEDGIPHSAQYVASVGRLLADNF